jgi:hypothetical protein
VFDEGYVLEVVINTLLAAVGGVVKSLVEAESRNGPPPKLTRFIVSAIVSMFVGVIVFVLCKNFEVPIYLTAGLTALAGYMGAPVLDLLARIAQKKIEKGLNERE